VPDQSTDLDRVGRLHERAVSQNLSGRPGRGAATVTQALALLGAGPAQEPDSPQVHGAQGTAREVAIARLLATLAKSEVEVIGIERGLATMDRASRWGEVDGGRDLLAFLHSQRGLILFRGGRFADALSEFNFAAESFDESSGADKCRLLINRGALYVESGDLTSARSDLSQCVELAGRLGLQVLERIAVHNLGCLEFFAGDLPLALRTMDEGMVLGGDTQPGIAYLDRARVLLAAGLHREADESLAAAAQQLGKDRCWQDVGEVELTRAESALLAGDVAASRRLAARARDRFRRHGNDRWRRNAELVLLQADLASARPPARLAPPALRLVEEFRTAGFVVHARTALLLAAEIFERLKQLDRARSLAAEAGVARPSDPISVRLHTRYVQARLDFAADDKAAARRHLRSGLAELADYQAHFGSIDLQTASAVHGSRLAELDIEAALAERRAVAVFAAMERTRAMSSRARPVRPPEDRSIALLLAELRQSVDRMRSTDEGPESAVQRRRVAEIQRALRSRSWQAQGTGGAREPAGRGAVEDALVRADSVLACYVQSHGSLYATLVGRGRRRIVEIGAHSAVTELANRVRADLDALAGGYLPGGLLSAVQSSLGRSFGALDRLLVAPLQLPDSRVVIVPTGVLGTLPWTNLPSLRGRPVVVAPSATSWLESSSATVRTGAPAVVAIAGPELARSHDEVKGIGELWPQARVFDEAAALRSALADAMRTATVVHVAAHGEHQPENPLFSSIRLADGPLFAYELDQTVRAAEHVILSACELGQATIRPGDEALGLTSVLLHLGTRSVISGVAKVHDDIAADVMTRYHAALSAGVDSAQALAMSCDRQHGWPAPFVCFGAAWARADLADRRTAP
jgi:tetratricopeptide (TPR) repeat protein